MNDSKKLGIILWMVVLLFIGVAVHNFHVATAFKRGCYQPIEVVSDE